MPTTETTTLYEIINPSDPYTLRAAEIRHAVAAVLILGEGHYGLHREDGSQAVPIFLFGGHEEWLAKEGIDLDAVIRDEKPAIAEVLQSVMLGGFDERRDTESALAYMTPEAGRAWLAERHDRHRSSMNDIGGRAHSLAKAILSKIDADA